MDNTKNCVWEEQRQKRTMVLKKVYQRLVPHNVSLLTALAIVGILYLPAFAYADLTSATSTYNLPVDATIYSNPVARTAGNRYSGFAYASSSEWGIASYSFQACKTAGTTFDYYGYIYDLKNGTILATSTEPFLPSTNCNTYSTSTVFFNSLAITDNNWYAIVLGRQGGAVSPTYYLNINNYGNGSLANQAFIATSFGDWISASTFFNFGGLPVFYVSDDLVVFGCDSTGGDDIMCDMASTTDAIYEVGYTMQLYLGIFMLLLFGYMAFIYIRKYL